MKRRDITIIAIVCSSALLYLVFAKLLHKPTTPRDRAFDDKLIEAVKKCDLQGIEDYLARGANPNARDRDGNSALVCAIDQHTPGSDNKKRKLEMTTLLIDHGADVNAARKGGITALMLAFNEGDPDILRLLVKKGANVNAKDGQGYTTLMWGARWWEFQFRMAKMVLLRAEDIAATHKHILGKFRFLIKKGADVNAKSNDGRTALMFAADHHPLEPELLLIKFFVEEGADVNAKSNDGRTALMLAADQGHLEVSSFLVGKGADINAKDKDGKTAFMSAVLNWKDEAARIRKKTKEEQEKLVYGGKPDVKTKPDDEADQLKAAFDKGKRLARLFLDKGADVNAADDNGETTLMKIVRFGQPDWALFLIENGADVNAKTKDGETALMKAAEYGRLEVIRLLVEKGADVDAKSKNGVTALMKAADLVGGLEALRFLVERGANVNAKSENGMTALMKVADLIGEEDAVRFLVEKGADVNAQAKDGVTALMKAASIGALKSAQFLIEKGANVNAKTKDGETSLMFAVRAGRPELTRLLLEKAADVDARNKDGKTAPVLAQELDFTKIKRSGAKQDCIKIAELFKVHQPKSLEADQAPTEANSLEGHSSSDACAELKRQCLYAAAENAGAADCMCRSSFGDITDEAGRTPLMLAAASGSFYYYMPILLERGYNVNAKDDLGQTAIMYAVEAGRKASDARIVELLFEGGAEMNLFVAAALGDEREVLRFIRSGSDVNARTPTKGRSALIIAAQCEHLGTVRLLLDNGADVNAEDNEKQTALWLTYRNEWEIANLLKARGAKTTLLIAAGFREGAEVRRLVDSGADIDARGPQGRTALLEALYRESFESAMYLIEKGADVNARDMMGNTPLILAAKTGNIDIVLRLVERGADVNARSDKGVTPLTAIADSFGTLEDTYTYMRPQIAKYLIRKGANVNIIPNGPGLTPLMTAARSKQPELVKLFIENGADVNERIRRTRTLHMLPVLQCPWESPVKAVTEPNKTSPKESFQPKPKDEAAVRRWLITDASRLDEKSDDGLTSLMFAAEEDDRQSMELLLSAGADVHAKTTFNNKTALHMVTGHEATELLIQHGADVNVQTSVGATPLMVAVDRGGLKKCKLLVDNGADINMKSMDGHTALDVAESGLNQDITNFLKSKGAMHGFTTKSK